MLAAGGAGGPGAGWRRDGRRGVGWGCAQAKEKKGDEEQREEERLKEVPPPRAS